jgi:hypothetical protein
MTDSDYSAEMHDKVTGMAEDLDAFRQVDYLFLFDHELKFSKRADFVLDDSYISNEDF